MNFINKNNGSCTVLFGPFGISHDLFNFLDSREHSGELDELRLRHMRDNLCESSFTCAGWSPEDQRASVITLNLSTKRLARTNQLFLPNKRIERAGTHAVSKRTGAIARVGPRNSLEKAHKIIFTTESQRH